MTVVHSESLLVPVIVCCHIPYHIASRAIRSWQQDGMVIAMSEARAQAVGAGGWSAEYAAGRSVETTLADWLKHPNEVS